MIGRLLRPRLLCRFLSASLPRMRERDRGHSSERAWQGSTPTAKCAVKCRPNYQRNPEVYTASLAFLSTSTGIVDDTLTNPCGTGTQPPSKRVWTSLELAKLPLDPVTARRVWLEEVANEHEIDRRKFEQELKAQQRT